MSMRQLKINKSIISRESESLDKYLNEVNKVPLNTPEEEERLAVLIQKGDKDALDRLVKANLRFVVSVAKQYQYQGLSLSDLISEGNIGLIHAARNFDATRGFKFITYAVWWIRQHMVKALADDARVVRLPLNKIALQRRIQNASSVLEQKLGRSASAEELAEQMNMDPENITDSLCTTQKQVSLDIPLDEDGETSMMDILKNPNAEEADEKLIHDDSLQTELSRSFQLLNERQKETICYFFGIGTGHALGLDEIARKFDLTRERVRQIKDKALAILRTTPGFYVLRSYLGA